MQVWNRGNFASRETLFVRYGVQDAFKWTGQQFICRQAYTAADYELGLVKHCPHCYDEVLKQVSNTNCPYCYGTGYEGGYKPPFLLWGALSTNSDVNEYKESDGERMEQNMQFKTGVPPIFRHGDIFVEVRRIVQGSVKELGRVFLLNKPLRLQTVNGWVSNNTNDRDEKLERMAVSQQGTAQLLLPTDCISENSEKFFSKPASFYVPQPKHSSKPPQTEYKHKLPWRP